MKYKILHKIAILFFGITLTYFLSLFLVITPKIEQHLKDSELQSAKIQLERIASIIDLKTQSLKTHEEDITNTHKESIKEVAKVAYVIMDEAYSKFKQKKLSKKEAINLAFQTLSRVQYGHDKDYIFVLDSKGNVLLHPDKRYYLKNILYTTDYNGKLFIGDLISGSVKNKEAYARYTWPKANSEEVSEKIAYSIYHEGLDMVISTGVYLSNIALEIKNEKQKITENIRYLLYSIQLGETGYIYVVDGNNNMLIHPNALLEGKNVAHVIDPVSKRSMIEMMKEAYKNDKLWSYNWDRQTDKGNYSYKKISHVKYNDYFDWYIVSSIYEVDFLKAANDLKSMILQISIIVFLGAFYCWFLDDQSYRFSN